MDRPTNDLFDVTYVGDRRELLAADAWLLPGLAADDAGALLAELVGITQVAPFRHVRTPGGLAMSVAMTNCGTWGWVSDRRGYRYEHCDPLSGRPWPPMPSAFAVLAGNAAAAAGFADFVPDACLVNRYVPGARMSLHQDKDERDLGCPIVSVSLGLPAVFLWGGQSRSARPRRVLLRHGDVVTWGGESRLHYHGILAVEAGHHALVGAQRLNLTFRRAS
jgi:alkylated DNA repair protein (DNA oxidative demethylase)